MEYRIYILNNGAFELVNTTEEMPTDTEGYQVEAYNRETGTTTIIKKIEEQ